MIEVHDPRFYAQLLRGSLGLAEAHMDGMWEPTTSSRASASPRATATRSTACGAGCARSSRPLQRALGRARNTIARSRAQIAAHYDLGNDLYELFLDESMMYSCAVYTTAPRLEEAQLAQARARLPQLDLGPATTCSRSAPAGAALALHAAPRARLPRDDHDDLARAARAHAAARCAPPGSRTASPCCCGTTATSTGTYDKLVSIEMIEAVGWRDFDTFFAAAASCWRPTG